MYPSTSPLSTVSDDEKEAKIKREDGDKLRLWIAFFLLLSVAAFFAGGGLQRVKNQKEYSSFDSQPVAVVGNSKQQFSQEQEPAPTLEELQTIVNKLDTEVRNYKNRPGIIMETDPAGLELTKKLQRATEALIRSKYHPSGRFRVRVHLVFPESIPDYSEATSKGSLLLELNDIHVLPCSVYQFLEIASTWKSGSFHRNAGHVLQVQSRSSYEHRNMPFQEYSPEFPHTKGTTGYAGRPSSTGWYVSIQDNTRNHGPGSQQKQNPTRSRFQLRSRHRRNDGCGASHPLTYPKSRGWTKRIKSTFPKSLSSYPHRILLGSPWTSTVLRKQNRIAARGQEKGEGRFMHGKCLIV